MAKLRDLKKKIADVKAHGASQYNPGWHEALSLRSLIITSEAVALAGHMRQESRGAHTRLDFEGEREEWGACNIIIRKGADGDMEIEKFERADPPKHLSEIGHANIEELESGKVGGDVSNDSNIDLDAAFAASSQQVAEKAHG